MFFKMNLFLAAFVLLISSHANANSSIEKDFLKCMGYIEYNRGLESNILRCGEMLQSSIDDTYSDKLKSGSSKSKNKEKNHISSSLSFLKDKAQGLSAKSPNNVISRKFIYSLLDVLNERIDSINMKHDENFLPYELYEDKLDTAALDNIRKIQYFRDNLREYKGLSFFNGKATSYDSVDDMKLDFALSKRGQSSLHKNLERNIRDLKRLAPNFILNPYIEEIASFKEKYDAESSFIELVVQIKGSSYALNQIIGYQQVKGSSLIRKQDWEKVPDFKLVEKASKNKKFSSFKPIFDQYFAEYEEAKKQTEEIFLKDFLKKRHKEAITYSYPLWSKYFLPKKSDDEIKAAFKKFQQDVEFWSRTFPYSEWLSQYKSNMSKTERAHKDAIKEGHELYQKGVLAAIKTAKAPTSDLLQDSVEKHVVYEVAKKYFATKAKLIDVLGNTVLSVDVVSQALRVNPWTIYTKFSRPTKQQTKYITVVEDDKGGCHALILSIERRYAKDGTLGGVVLTDFAPSYPMMCNNI